MYAKNVSFVYINRGPCVQIFGLRKVPLWEKVGAARLQTEIPGGERTRNAIRIAPGQFEGYAIPHPLYRSRCSEA